MLIYNTLLATFYNHKQMIINFANKLICYVLTAYKIGRECKNLENP